MKNIFFRYLSMILAPFGPL